MIVNFEAQTLSPASQEASQEVSNTLSLGTQHFQEANQRVREALNQYDTVSLHDVFAQRYLGCTMPAGKSLKIFGTPGNDMAAYLDGGYIEVFGNAQDQVGNTMNGGTIVVHGRCGDAAGYAMRGGEIFIQDDCGWRVGINMKQYKDKSPLIVIGGNAGSFLGEYMAGGTIVLFGTAGDYLGTGMHGGKMYLAQNPESKHIPHGIEVMPLESSDVAALAPILEKYSSYFPEKKELVPPVESFVKLMPTSSRPYANLYTHCS